jgi:hypothetical protein
MVVFSRSKGGEHVMRKRKMGLNGPRSQWPTFQTATRHADLDSDTPGLGWVTQWSKTANIKSQLLIFPQCKPWRWTRIGRSIGQRGIMSEFQPSRFASSIASPRATKFSVAPSSPSPKCVGRVGGLIVDVLKEQVGG